MVAMIGITPTPIATMFVQYCRPVHLAEALLVIALTSTPVPILHRRIFPVVQVHLAAENTNLANVCQATLGIATPELAPAHHPAALHPAPAEPPVLLFVYQYVLIPQGSYSKQLVLHFQVPEHGI